MPPRLQHCGLIVADLDRSRGFYGGALGLEEVPRPDNFVFEGAWFQVGDDQLHLLLETDTTSSAGGADRGDGYDQIFMLDPDGYVIELFQYTGEDQSDAPLRAPIRS